jgi:predicted ester cyclase
MILRIFWNLQCRFLMSVRGFLRRWIFAEKTAGLLSPRKTFTGSCEEKRATSEQSCGAREARRKIPVVDV